MILVWESVQLIDEEREPGLGNGGLGRLAACFMDSMTYLNVTGRGNTLRYHHGLFKQEFVDCEQVETRVCAQGCRLALGQDCRQVCLAAPSTSTTEVQPIT